MSARRYVLYSQTNSEQENRPRIPAVTKSRRFDTSAAFTVPNGPFACERLPLTNRRRKVDSTSYLLLTMFSFTVALTGWRTWQCP